MIVAINVGTTSIKMSAFQDDERSLTKLSTTNTPFADGVSHLNDALHQALNKLKIDAADLRAIGVRVVHGGSTYTNPTVVNDDILADLRTLSAMAPLHNPLAISTIEWARHTYPKAPVIAVFDTTFHASMPQHAALYAIPPSLVEQFGIRRYGFHGLAHESMLRQYCNHTDTLSTNATLITVQLGSGCSICAIENGISVDTSMGFSPLEGLISRTRSGDIDPAVVDHIVANGPAVAADVLRMLNQESGLSGVSGTDGSMTSLLTQAASGNARAKLAVDMFVYRVQKYIGAYDLILGGNVPIVFGGGISEHTPEVVRTICSRPSMKITIKPEIESANDVSIQRITTADSAGAVYLSRVDEEALIAQHAHEIIPA